MSQQPELPRIDAVAKSYTWPSIFTKRRIFDRASENQPYLEYLRDMGVALGGDDDSSSSGGSDDEGDDAEDNGEGDDNDNDNDNTDNREDRGEKRNELRSNKDNDILNPNEDLSLAVRPFMKGVSGEEEKRISLDQVDVVSSFAESPISGGALEGQGGDEEPLIGFVDDSCASDGPTPDSPEAEQHRPQQGGLTQCQLNEVLGIPRFSVATNTAQGTDQSDDNVINADQRKIFFTTLGAKGIAVLARRTPVRERQAVTAFMYRHLKPTASMGVTLPVKGFRTFAMHLHIPFYVLGDPTLDPPHRDTRKWPNGEPLRASCALDCLSTSRDTKEKQWLYEAQTSVLMTGIDHYVWTAICTVDTYYCDTKSKESESVRSLRRPKFRLSKQAKQMWDPLVGRGTLPLILSKVRDPRRYFLAVCEARIGWVLLQWGKIVGAFSDNIKQKRPPSRRSGLGQDRVKQLMNEFEEWIEETLSNIENFITCLDKAIRMWKGFCQTDIGYFSDLDSKSEGRGLEEIGKHFYTMSTYRSDLQALKTNILDVKRPAAQRFFDSENRAVAEKGYEVAKADNSINQKVHVVALTVFFFSPLSLVAGIFNMPESVLPFRPNPLTFFLTLVMLAFAYSISYALMRPSASDRGKPPPATGEADLLDPPHPEQRGLQARMQESWERLSRGLDRGIVRLALRGPSSDQENQLPV
ncbi:hypothetical protein B0H67DRAFT_594764 [Lasiosphaeris hirsuta]|uniref:Uncharacterized protein n=1 Tax=Lasiosphaeris hirsuta TaxID=260670 RepID=A0AA40DJQ9_9PEZI|nr:hypothetical protein B0H67DRAFT_594764 [Lasiosphaeris hirsuta]